MRYRLKDEQGTGCLESRTFKTKKECREAIMGFASADTNWDILKRLSLTELCDIWTFSIEVV
jgi:hypothetical protein